MARSATYYHRHAVHVEVLDRPMLERDLALGLVDLGDLSIDRSRRQGSGRKRGDRRCHYKLTHSAPLLSATT